MVAVGIFQSLNIVMADNLSVAAGGGGTNHKLDGVVPHEHIAAENRDPKMVWYAPEKK